MQKTLELRLSIPQVAKLWGCSDRHVRNLVTRGELQALRIGSLIRFTQEMITKYETRQASQVIEMPDPMPYRPATPKRPAPAIPGMNSPGSMARLRSKMRDR